MLWIGANVVEVLRSWDPYPFILLNLLFSTQAAYAAPLILLSQNRQAERDRVKAEHDYAVNQLALVPAGLAPGRAPAGVPMRRGARAGRRPAARHVRPRGTTAVATGATGP